MVAHICDPSTWEAVAGRSLEVRGQPGLQSVLKASETLTQTDKKQNKPSPPNYLVYSFLVQQPRQWVITLIQDFYMGHGSSCL